MLASRLRFLLVLGCSIIFRANAQIVPNNQDCPGAIPICQGVYTQTNSYSGVGNIPNEINSGTSCLLSGEKNDVWYVFTVQTSGILNFTITPNNLNDDYDWSVFNLTTNTCAQIYTNPSLEVSCNYSGVSGPTGPNGQAGAQNNAPFPVTAGQTFVLNVSNFSSTQSGYTFDVGATTATIFDATAPYIKEVINTPPGAPLTCGINKVSLKFSENVNCNSLDTNDLAVACSNNIQHRVTKVQCKSTGTYSNTFDITVIPALTDSGAHGFYLTKIDSTAMTDLCGNSGVHALPSPQDTAKFKVKGILRTTTQTNVNCFGDSTGSAKVVPTNGTSPYLYSWLTNPVKTSNTATLLKKGSYTYIVKDAKNCILKDSVVITEQAQIVPVVVASWDTCGKGSAVASISATGGKLPYTYKWNDAASQTSDTATHLKEGLYSVTLVDSLGCDTIVPLEIVTAPIVHP